MVDGWFRRVSNNPNDLVLIADMVQFYEKELEGMHEEAEIRGNLEQSLARLPGIFDYRLEQLKSIKSVLQLLTIKLDDVKSQSYIKFAEHYPRDLKTTEIKQYVDGDQSVVAMKILVNEVQYLYEQYEGKIRSYEIKHYQLTNITKLRVAGVEDAVIEY